MGVLTDPDFVADDVQITPGRNRVDDGVLAIDDGEVILMRTGEDPVVDRLIASAPVEEVRAGRPRILVAPNAASGVFIVPCMSCEHWGPR